MKRFHLRNILNRIIIFDNKKFYCNTTITTISDSNEKHANEKEKHLKKVKKGHSSDSPHVHTWKKPEGYNTGINIYNSITKRKEPLILSRGKIATWYSCGPTVYDHAHIGHASSYVRQDVIRRVMLNMFNLDIVMVLGITDIDDKLIKRSNELGINYLRLAREYESEFWRDLKRLKILPPTVSTRVTEHIPQIISFIKKIIENGYAYKTEPEGNVYFDVNAYGKYGRLWTHKMETEIREASDKEKKSPRDFVLWKAAKPSEPYWPSPWGVGRPGWHIECSTMAHAVFGQNLDLHSGGDDLRFPHHENEIAQSECCFCNDQWTNYWVHTGQLHLKNDEFKMSKSLSNTISISDLLKKYSANQFRLFCLMRPYKQRIEYSSSSMEKSVRLHTNWSSFINSADAYIKGQLVCQQLNDSDLWQLLAVTQTKVETALADDFDTPKVLTAIEELIRKTNAQLSKKLTTEITSNARSPAVVAAIVAFVQRILELFGINISRKKISSASEFENTFENVVESVVKFRSNVRNFALTDEKGNSVDKQTKLDHQAKVRPLLKACDELRDDLRLGGVNIQDFGNVSTWDLLEQSHIQSQSALKNPKF